MREEKRERESDRREKKNILGALVPSIGLFFFAKLVKLH